MIDNVGELLIINNTLVSKRKTLGVVETAAGGAISSQLLSISGASNWFDHGIIAYSNLSKRKFLSTPASLLDEFGAVSEECARQMAVNMLYSTDIALAETSIAEKKKESRSSKKAGLSYIAVGSLDRGIFVKEYQFCGDRNEVRELIIQAALIDLKGFVLSV